MYKLTTDWKTGRIELSRFHPSYGWIFHTLWLYGANFPKEILACRSGVLKALRSIDQAVVVPSEIRIRLTDNNGNNLEKIIKNNNLALLAIEKHHEQYFGYYSVPENTEDAVVKKLLDEGFDAWRV